MKPITYPLFSWYCTEETLALAYMALQLLLFTSWVILDKTLLCASVLTVKCSNVHMYSEHSY